MLSIRDYLIVLITNTSHKTHLLSCVLRCSSKLQKIQSLENFVSMAIKDTQVPIYINTHCFCIFLISFPFFYFKNKLRQFSEHTLTSVFLVMAKSHCTCTFIKSSKEYCVLCVKNITRLHKCLHVMML